MDAIDIIKKLCNDKGTRIALIAIILIIFIVLLVGTLSGRSTTSKTTEPVIEEPLYVISNADEKEALLTGSEFLYPFKDELFRYDKYTDFVILKQYIGTAKNVELPTQKEGLPVIMIYDNAFSENPFIENIIVPDGYIYIGSDAFKDCAYLKSIKLPENTLQGFGEGTFSNCVSLLSIDIPKSVNLIPANFCNACESLKQVTISGSSVNDTVPAEQETETSTVSTETVERIIDNSAFYGCVSLEYVWIATDVISIDETAFSECSESIVLYGGVSSAAAVYAANNYMDFIILDKEEYEEMLNEKEEIETAEENSEEQTEKTKMQTSAEAIPDIKGTETNPKTNTTQTDASEINVSEKAAN